VIQTPNGQTQGPVEESDLFSADVATFALVAGRECSATSSSAVPLTTSNAKGLICAALNGFSTMSFACSQKVRSDLAKSVINCTDGVDTRIGENLLLEQVCDGISVRPGPLGNVAFVKPPRSVWRWNVSFEGSCSC
jgi:hypothetical protein